MNRRLLPLLLVPMLPMLACDSALTVGVDGEYFSGTSLVIAPTGESTLGAMCNVSDAPSLNAATSEPGHHTISEHGTITVRTKSAAVEHEGTTGTLSLGDHTGKGRAVALQDEVEVGHTRVYEWRCGDDTRTIKVGIDNPDEACADALTEQQYYYEEGDHPRPWLGFKDDGTVDFGVDFEEGATATHDWHCGSSGRLLIPGLFDCTASEDGWSAGLVCDGTVYEGG